MSVNIPPNPNVSTFNNLYWITSDNALTENIANKLYLKYPVAQGTENLQATNVQGTLNCNSITNFNADANIRAGNDLFLYDNQAVPTSSSLRQDTGLLTIANNKVSGNINLDTTNGGGTTATSLVINSSGIQPKGSAPITYPDGKVQNSAFTGGTAGTYTNTNMTIDSNGKISAISNGSVATPTLSAVLVAGNSAGSTSINMNSQNITGVNNIALTTINGAAYPPVVAADTLSAVLTAGNSAGSRSINMNNNAITGVNNLTLQTGSITYPDTKVQNSAFTGGAAGTYTNTNMTIDANGKISAISNGSAPVNLLPLNNTWTGTNTFNDDVSIKTGKDLFLFDNQAIPTNSILRQDTGSLTIANNAFNGVINFDTTNGSGLTTTNLSMGATSSIFSKDTYVNDAVFVMRDNDTTTTQVNMTYTAGQQVNFNLAPSTLSPTTTFQCYLNPAGSVISPLQITNTGIRLQGTAPITFPDNKVQTSAFTGGTAGTYTNTNMTIDANGKISAISSGSAGATPTLSQVLTAGNSAGSVSIDMNNQNITNANIISTTTNGNPFVMGGVNAQVAVSAKGISGSTANPIYMETLSRKITGNGGSIDITITLSNNYQNTINYMVFPSVYYGFTGSSGTYNAQNTANALNNFIIYNRTSTNFKFYCSKSTGNNVSIYLTFLVVYNSLGTDSTNNPASYS